MAPASAGEFTPAQRAEIGGLVKDYLLQNPEVLQDAMAELERRQKVQEEAKRQQEKLAKGKFDLNDFRQQIVQMKKMGSVKDLMGKIPGMNQFAGSLVCFVFSLYG